MSVARILVVDDEASMRELLGVILRRSGHEVTFAATGEAALAAALADPPQLVIHDLKMPGMSGLELLGRLKARMPDVPVIVVTAFATWDNTVEAMRLGAYDYVKKPFDTAEIRQVVERALAHAALVREHGAVPPGLDLIGASHGFRQVIDVVRRVAVTEATVLVLGESGTGKELVARLCHYASPRAPRPFIAVNCGAFTESLLESELFGHVRGAFTGAVADKKGLLQVAEGGTFFLDEVGEMAASTQVKLLRVLEERRVYPVGGIASQPVDVRFVCATNRDLADEVRLGRFRSDLYYRLNVIPITLPPLRDRREDIPLLAGHFVRKYAARLRRPITAISPALQSRLQAYAWPGNVRELENVVQRAIALGHGSVLTEVELGAAGSALAPPRIAAPSEAGDAAGASAPAELAGPEAAWTEDGIGPTGMPVLAPARAELPAAGLDLEATLANAERMLLEQALERTQHNVTRAAELLGITFRAMRYKLRKLGMRPERAS